MTPGLCLSPNPHLVPPTAQPVSTPPPRPTAILKAKLVEPKQDGYGFDEAPSALPPKMPRPGSGVEPAEAPIKKKKKKGFFSTAGPKQTSSAGSFGRGKGMSGFRLIGLIVAVVVAVGGGITGLGLSSKSDVETILTRQLDLTDEFVAALNGVTSLESAQASSPKILEIIRRMTENLEKNRHKKARQTDIAAVAARLKFRSDQVESKVFLATRRVAMIPGAIQALNFEQPLQRLAALEEELNREAQAEGLNVN